MGPLVYLLCAATALSCMVLIWRAYRRSKARLLFWSAVCFAFLTLNNVLIAVDLLLLPELDLFALRNLSSLAGISALLYGLIWEGR